VIAHPFDEDFMNHIGAPNSPVHLLPLRLDDNLCWLCPEPHAFDVLERPEGRPIRGRGVSEPPPDLHQQWVHVLVELTR